MATAMRCGNSHVPHKAGSPKRCRTTAWMLNASTSTTASTCTRRKPGLVFGNFVVHVNLGHCGSHFPVRSGADGPVSTTPHPRARRSLKRTAAANRKCSGSQRTSSWNPSMRSTTSTSTGSGLILATGGNNDLFKIFRQNLEVGISSGSTVESMVAPTACRITSRKTSWPKHGRIAPPIATSTATFTPRYAPRTTSTPTSKESHPRNRNLQVSLLSLADGFGKQDVGAISFYHLWACSKNENHGAHLALELAAQEDGDPHALRAHPPSDPGQASARPDPHALPPDEPQLPDPPANPHHRPDAPSPEEVQRWEAKLAPFHKAAGHPTNSNLVRLLQEAGHPRLRIDKAKEFKCSACEALRPGGLSSGQVPPAATYPLYQAWQAVGLDVSEWDVPRVPRKVKFALFIELATKLRVVCRSCSTTSSR